MCVRKSRFSNCGVPGETRLVFLKAGVFEISWPPVTLTKESVPSSRRRAVRDILLYGGCGGVLITVLKLTEYRFLVVEHSVEIYVALVAALFAGLGIWLAAHMVERAKASGASQQKMDETERQAKQFKQMYNNPAINVALTFTEVFPIGLVVTLLSAGILRKKVREPET